MRPDRIIVGEVRSGEVVDMLQAMNTGHDGSLTTIHANTPRDALLRLETLVAMAGLNIPNEAVRRYISSALNVVIHISRLIDGSRKVTSLSEITGMEGNIITMQEIFSFEQTGLHPTARSRAGSRCRGSCRGSWSGSRPTASRFPTTPSTRMEIFESEGESMELLLVVFIFIASFCRDRGPVLLLTRPVEPRDDARKESRASGSCAEAGGVDMVRRLSEIPWFNGACSASSADVNRMDPSGQPDIPGGILPPALGGVGAGVGFSLRPADPQPSGLDPAGVLAAPLPWLYVFIKKQRRLARFEEQLPEAMDMLARSLKAGHAFTGGSRWWPGVSRPRGDRVPQDPRRDQLRRGLRGRAEQSGRASTATT